MPLSIDDLPKSARQKIKAQHKARKPRGPATFPKEQVRQEAIAVLATIKHLTKDQRNKVMEFALRMNEL